MSDSDNSSTFDITACPAWSLLESAADDIATLDIGELLRSDRDRVEKYSLNTCGLYLDYSKNRLDDALRDQLISLAESSPLRAIRDAMFGGDQINTSEGRPVLHTALRADAGELSQLGLADVAADIAEQQQRMARLSDAIRTGAWKGSTGKAITDVVNLGIGGSDLGPRLACEALKEFSQPGLRCHFVSNVDGELIASTLKSLDPETTLVIVASKTFTTQETLLNARTAAAWFTELLGLEHPFSSPHFVGVTAKPENAEALGFSSEQLLLFWDWVGGRYSLWSTIGLAVSIAVGYSRFDEMLRGARAMDAHFKNSDFAENMPVIMALLGIWYGNFLGAETTAVVPYCERLKEFPFYLQQLDMESNGKSVTRDGVSVTYGTGPIVWGLTGTNGQHSFFQLLHQGTHLVPVDFIAVLEDAMSSPEHHRVLLANMFAQSAALMQGKHDAALPAWRQYAGNRPSNVLLLDALTPEKLGALLALYEHKIFVQGCLWNINSFDQWGVELGKVLANELLSDDTDPVSLDPSSRSLLAKLADIQSD